MAFVCALMSVVGFFLKHRGAVAAPAVEWGRPLASTVALFRSPVYTLGCVVATTSWGFHVAALALALFVGLATLAGIALVVARGASGLALAIAAGLMWAGSDVTIKALSGKTEELGLAVVAHPFALVILVLSLAGLLVSARSLQIGPVVPVIAFTSTTANVLTIAAGPVVFGEPLPEDPLGLAVRLLAFALVIVAAALTPAPVRVARDLEPA